MTLWFVEGFPVFRGALAGAWRLAAAVRDAVVRGAAALGAAGFVVGDLTTGRRRRWAFVSPMPRMICRGVARQGPFQV
ncbi:MAG: hypothetical protein QNJ90_01085 [Planctomycetota bacterium]|nr:hypothetical protein [Planctomycetota bacterium]